METKKCNKCGVVKPLDEFNRQKDGKLGRHSRCKLCVKAYRLANLDKESQQKKAYYEANKERIKKRHKKWREKNKDYLKDYHRSYVIENQERKKAYDKAYYQANKDRIAKRGKTYQNKRRATDPAYRMKCSVGGAVRAALKKQGTIKGGQTFSALPYTPTDLVEHLEKQFDDKMSWENYGTYWHLDHIYPQSLLPYDSLDHPNFQKCWALDNLQPLEKMENIRKSNKVIA
jgi:hypothetical protein